MCQQGKSELIRRDRVGRPHVTCMFLLLETGGKEVHTSVNTHTSVNFVRQHLKSNTINEIFLYFVILRYLQAYKPRINREAFICCVESLALILNSCKPICIQIGLMIASNNTKIYYYWVINLILFVLLSTPQNQADKYSVFQFLSWI